MGLNYIHAHMINAHCTTKTYCVKTNSSVFLFCSVSMAKRSPFCSECSLFPIKKRKHYYQIPETGVVDSCKRSRASLWRPTKKPRTKNSAPVSVSVPNRVDESEEANLDDGRGKTPWKITKKLTRSDLGHMSRLMVGSKEIKKHVLPFLNNKDRVASEKGVKVRVFDLDTYTEHLLVFKQRPVSKSYVFIGRWNSDFKERRELKPGDVIGLYWDRFYSRINFGVLDRPKYEKRK